jgi:hypothetical protein
MACEDFPCCGHESGCCPDFDESGKQLNMICTCGKKLPLNNRSSLCDVCLNADEFGENPEQEADDDFYELDDDEFCGKVNNEDPNLPFHSFIEATEDEAEPFDDDDAF